MSSYMGNLRNILGQCQDAADGKLSQDEQAALASRVKGAFMSMPMFNSVVRSAEARDWHVVEGALANYIDVQEAAGHSTSITQNATAIARAEASSYVSVVQSLPESTLSEDDKTMLTGMLATLQGLNGEQKKSKLVEIVKWLSDKAVDVSIAVIPMLASML